MYRTGKLLPLLSAACATALVAVSFCPVALGDTVTKKDGTTVEGKVVADDETGVTVKTSLGEIKIARSDVRSVEKGKTSAELFKEKWDAVDRKDATALLDLADWCKENKLSREAKKVYREIVDKVDPENEAARRELGYINVEGKWKLKSEIDAEKKAAGDAEKKAKADKAKADKAKADKNKKSSGKSATKSDLGADMEFPAEVDGFVEAGKEAADADAKEKADLDDFFGAKFSVMTSEHFHLGVQMPPDEAEFHLRVAEKCYVDVNRLMGFEPDFKIFGPRVFQFFHVQQKTAYNDLVEWIHKSVVQLDFETKRFLKDGGGLSTWTEKGPLGACFEGGAPLKNRIPQWLGTRYIAAFTRGGARDWLEEGFGMFLAIHEFGVSLMTSTTMTKYENKVEIADKNSDNAYKLVCWDIIEGRAEGDYSWNTMRQKKLNALDYVDLAKCWSVVDFLMLEENRENFKKYCALLATTEDEEAALQKSFGWSGMELDKRWAEYVRKAYEKAPPSAKKKSG